VVPGGRAYLDAEPLPVDEHEPEGAGGRETADWREHRKAALAADGRGHRHEKQADQRRKPRERGPVGHRGEAKPEVPQRRDQRDLRHRSPAGRDQPRGLESERKRKKCQERRDVREAGARADSWRASDLCTIRSPSENPRDRNCRGDQRNSETQGYDARSPRLQHSLLERRGGQRRHPEGCPADARVFAPFSGQAQAPFRPGKGAWRRARGRRSRPRE
jgi:hypothetical protein